LGQKKKDVDEESIGSNLSDDVWAEITKFNRDRFDEEKVKHRKDMLLKKLMIKETLDR
jgi:hypothetical protein